MSILWLFLRLFWAADEINLSYKTTNLPVLENEYGEAVIMLTIYWGHGFYGANGWCLHCLFTVLLRNEITPKICNIENTTLIWETYVASISQRSHWRWCIDYCIYVILGPNSTGTLTLLSHCQSHQHRISFSQGRNNKHEDTCILEHTLMIFNIIFSSTFLFLVAIPSTRWNMSFMNVQSTCPTPQRRWRGLKSMSMRYSFSTFCSMSVLQSYDGQEVWTLTKPSHCVLGLLPLLHFDTRHSLLFFFSSVYCWLSNAGIKSPKHD